MKPSDIDALNAIARIVMSVFFIIGACGVILFSDADTFGTAMLGLVAGYWFK